jgi:RNA polymerase sigma factor (sigma-70 family)
MTGEDMTSDDMSLLREYAQSHSEQAFATLVSRHINGVYSVAMRQLHDHHQAEEVTQAVFIILAKKASTLSPKTILPSWLCRTARYVSSDTLKIQRRRRIREQESQMQSLLNEPASDAWNQIAPLLDDALDCLGEKEHDAVALRFLGGRDLRQVGAAMGIGEDAARMRVNRGVEKLRKFFAKRGVTLSATSIAGAVAANSVQAAPVGLAATITATTLAGTTATTAAIIAATKAVAMTTLQKTILGAGFAIAVGTGIYEARQATNARVETQSLQQAQAPLVASAEQLQRELSEATNRLAGMADALAKANSSNRELMALRGEVTRLRRESQQLMQSRPKGEGDTSSLADKAWLDRIGRLRQRLEQTPEAQIPELKYLEEEDWLDAARGKLDTEDDYRAAFSRLRASGENRFLHIAAEALKKYLETHHDQFPAELSQLSLYFDTPPAEEVLTRYHVTPSSDPRETNGWVITLKSPDSEALYTLGKNGVSGSSVPESELLKILEPAMKACMDANPMINNRRAAKIEDLAPYLTTPEQVAAYQKLMQGREAASK